MLTEDCDACGATVSMSETVHMLIHTGTDVGVVDHYVCRECYEDRVAPVFATGEGEDEDVGDAGGGNAGGEDADDSGDDDTGDKDSGDDDVTDGGAGEEGEPVGDGAR